MYSFTTRIRYSETGADARLQIMPMISYLQDVCVLQCEDRGVGVEGFNEHGYAWFLLAWQIHIHELPRLSQRVTVATAPYDFGKLSVGRCCWIEDEAGRPLIEADSNWCVMNLARMRPTHVPQDVADALYDGDERRDLPPMSRKIALVGEGTKAEAIPVSKYQLDTNQHVNNVQYVGMALEAAGVRESDISRIDIQYKQAATLGDTIVPVLYHGEQGATVDMSSPDAKHFATAALFTR